MRGLGKILKKGMVVKGVPIEEGFKPSSHYDTKRLKGETLKP